MIKPDLKRVILQELKLDDWQIEDEHHSCGDSGMGFSQSCECYSCCRESLRCPILKRRGSQVEQAWRPATSARL